MFILKNFVAIKLQTTNSIICKHLFIFRYKIMKYNKLNIITLGIIVIFIVLGCDKSKPTEAVAIKDFCKAENAGSGAVIEGYVWTNESVQCKKNLNFYDSLPT